ncbi:MAG: TetR family transcriptional regulator [Desulfosarcinaceae bacterium]
MKRCTRNDEETKYRLIQAAGGVFVRKGFQSAAVREIGSRAGTHVGAVNYHFRDREGLYAAVIDASHQSMVEKHPPDLGLQVDAQPEEKLRAFIHSFLLRIIKALRPESFDPADIERIADHIARFSLRGIQAFRAE